MPEEVKEGGDEFAVQGLASLNKNAANNENSLNEAIVFKEGNASNIKNFLASFERKLKLIIQTIEPLTEVALIELLGNSNAYERTSSNINPTKDFDLNVKFVYTVNGWLTSKSATSTEVAQDADYVYNKLKVVKGVKSWKSCTINLAEGTLTIEFIC
jgi:hypothetical protein